MDFKKHYNKIIVLGMVAVLILVVSIVFNMRDASRRDKSKTNSDILNDVLADGKHNEDGIQLLDGELFFRGYKDSFLESKVALPKGDKFEWTLEQINDYMGKDILLKYIPSKLKIDINESQNVYIRDDGAVPCISIIHTYSENIGDYESAWLQVILSKVKDEDAYKKAYKEEFEISYNKNISDSVESEGIWYDFFDGTRSNIRGVEIILIATYVETLGDPVHDSFYNAAFLYEGIAYEIRSSQVSQKEFIEVLLSIIE